MPSGRSDWPTIVREVREAVLETGGLTREEIIETWGLDEEEYQRLHSELKRLDGFESGGRHIGGIKRADKPRSAREDEGFDLAEFRSEGWEGAAARRLSELLDFRKLEELLGDLRYTLRQARLKQTGSDRRGTKEELAQALITSHGVDLFCSTEIREAVAAATGLKAPGRWHPGKARAREFVVRAGFPSELAGVASDESKDDFEFLEGRFRLEPLHPFQKEVQRALLEVLVEPLGRRCIVTLPTGGGKTRVAVESLAYWLEDRFDRAVGSARRGTILWLAHTEELCEQAASCFRQVWESSDNVCPLTLVRFWGSYTSDLLEHRETLRQALDRPAVLVSTPQRIGNILDERVVGGDVFLEMLGGSLGLILIDEAHRAAAPTYRRVLDRLAKGEAPPSVVGLTATPFRMEYLQDDPEGGTRELKEIFRRLIEPTSLGPDPRVALQELGVLARPQFQVVQSHMSIRIPGVDAEEGPLEEEEIERIDRVLATRADNTPRRFLVLEKILEVLETPEASVLYFGPSVRDANCMAFLLRQRGIRAAALSGSTRDASRRELVKKFKRGELQVLCNCEVLTTGFDAPRVTHVVVARPTVSQVLYEQIIGRGLRGPKFGGTASCTIIDVEDDFRGPRPALGYERFRGIWKRLRPKTPPRMPPEPEHDPPAAVVPSVETPSPTNAVSPWNQEIRPPDDAPSLAEDTVDSDDDRLGWPETWEELSKWFAARGEDTLWIRESLARLARHLRRGWAMDEETKRRCSDLLKVAVRNGFRLRSVRREQGGLFESGV